LKGEFLELGNLDMQRLYPAESLRDKSSVMAPKRYFEAAPLPDILLTRHMSWLYMSIDTDRLRKIPVKVEAINEQLADRYRVPARARLTVPHDLTKEKLAEAGVALRAAYPQIKGELVGYFMTEHGYHGEIGLHMAQKARHHEHLTFFICGAARTPPAGPGRLAEMILFNAEKLGIRDRITLITYDYARQHKTVENPYQGLLHEADHIVYESGSSSIMSEALFTGKSLHMANHYYDCDALVAAKAITPPAPHAPFVTKPIRLPDATAAVARAIARQYRLKTLFR
jgi:hypothetical protein